MTGSDAWAEALAEEMVNGVRPGSYSGSRGAFPGAADPYQAAARSARRLAELTGQPRHDVAVVLGSGWAPAADALAAALGADVTEIPVSSLGGFTRPTVPGHAGTVRSLAAGNLRVLVFVGRTHLYEGLPVSATVHGVRTAVAAVTVVALTNAAGGIRASYQVGSR